MNDIAHLAAANFSKLSTKSHFGWIGDKLHHSACHKHLTVSNKTGELILISSQKNLFWQVPMGMQKHWLSHCLLCCGKLSQILSQLSNFKPNFCPIMAFCQLVSCTSTCCWCGNNMAARCSVGFLEHWKLFLQFFSLEASRRLARMMPSSRVNQTENTTNATLLWCYINRKLQVWKHRLPAATFSCLNHSCGT